MYYVILASSGNLIDSFDSEDEARFALASVVDADRRAPMSSR